MEMEKKEVFFKEGDIVYCDICISTSLLAAGKYIFRISPELAVYNWATLIEKGRVSIRPASLFEKKTWFTNYNLVGLEMTTIELYGAAVSNS